MHKIYILISLLSLGTFCQPPTNDVYEQKNIPTMDPTNNQLSGLTNENLHGFQWINAPAKVGFDKNEIHIITTKGSDFFNNPEDGSITATAPFLFKEVSEDFIMTAHVKPDFNSVWNACALMVYKDSSQWIKFAFENSDATGKSIVSVVTNGVSDDANGVILNEDETIWLSILRKGDIYALHWSRDGKNFKMARLASLPNSGKVKIGMEAQSPVGDTADHRFLFFTLDYRTAQDLRAGQ